MSARRSAPSGERAGLASKSVLWHPVTLRQVESEDSGESKSFQVDARAAVSGSKRSQRHVMRRPSADRLGMTHGPLVACSRGLWRYRWLTR